jgi:hypothetical protein
MARSISYTEAMDLMHRKDSQGRKVPFSITFTTRDKRRTAKGSRHITIKAAETAGAKHDLVKASQLSIRPLSGEKDHPIPVHIRLIEYVNGMLVL